MKTPQESLSWHRYVSCVENAKSHTQYTYRVEKADICFKIKYTDIQKKKKEVSSKFSRPIQSHVTKLVPETYRRTNPRMLPRTRFLSERTVPLWSGRFSAAPWKGFSLSRNQYPTARWRINATLHSLFQTFDHTRTHSQLLNYKQIAALYEPGASPIRSRFSITHEIERSRREDERRRTRHTPLSKYLYFSSPRHIYDVK